MSSDELRYLLVLYLPISQIKLKPKSSVERLSRRLSRSRPDLAAIEIHRSIKIGVSDTLFQGFDLERNGAPDRDVV